VNGDGAISYEMTVKQLGILTQNTMVDCKTICFQKLTIDFLFQFKQENFNLPIRSALLDY
jgi:hypothetical protein